MLNKGQLDNRQQQIKQVLMFVRVNIRTRLLVKAKSKAFK